MAEAASLTADERREAAETVAGAIEGRVPLVVGVSAATAAQAGAYAADARAVGAVAVMSLPPLGYRADERELQAYFATLGEAAGIPIMLYNNPEASGVDLS